MSHIDGEHLSDAFWEKEKRPSGTSTVRGHYGEDQSSSRLFPGGNDRFSVPEQGGASLIPEGPLNPGVLHTVATGSGGHLGLYRIETQVTPGSGKSTPSGFGSNASAKEAVKVGFDYFKANASRVSVSIKAGDHDYHLHVVEHHNSGPTTAMTLATLVALCSAVMAKPAQSQIVVLGSMSLGGNIVPVENLAESLQAAFDAGAKRILLPMASAGDIPTWVG